MVLSMDRWKGKVAIVTGASAGCGASIAEQLVRHGVIVVGLARRKERMEALSEKLKGESGKLHAFKADIRKEEDIKAAYKWTIENVGPVSILVNNAAIIKPSSSLVKGDPNDWRDILDTNVYGPAILTQEAVQGMIANKIDGHVIHINSVAGHYVVRIPNLNMYPASKFALTAMTETLRQELCLIDSKIKVTSISPGYINTEMGMSSILAHNKDVSNNIPKLESDDVADAVIYVLSTPPHVQVHELMVRPVGEQV